MHVTILALGSTGDVLPFATLGAALRTRGHAVRLATFAGFQSLVVDHGLDFWPIRGDAEAILSGGSGLALTEAGQNVLRQWWAVMRAFGSMAADFAHDLRPLAAQPTDLLLAQTPGALYGIDLAEALGVPLVQGAVIPLIPTAAFVAPGVPPIVGRLPGGSRGSYLLLEQLVWQWYRPAVNRLRRELGLRPWPLRGYFRRLERDGVLLLNGFSPHVVPPPADWPARVVQTGYWLPPPTEWTPPDPLRRFLDVGPAPLFIGFGSMTIRDPQQATAQIRTALAQTGQRALLQAGWAGLGRQPLPDSMHRIDAFVPYDWLLPRMAAAIHHGGSSTTAQALRAGVPSLVVPFLFDQFFWGRRVAALGAGPPPLPFRRLTAGRLAQRINQLVGDDALRHAAVALGQRLRAEKGVDDAVRALERVVDAPAPPAY